MSEATHAPYCVPNRTTSLSPRLVKKFSLAQLDLFYTHHANNQEESPEVFHNFPSDEVK
jgi:hypothetical protein